MKRFLLTGILLCVVSSVPAQDKPLIFSGIWTLDRDRTKDLPATLESYSLKVTQDAQQLSIEAAIVGEIRSAPGGGRGGRGETIGGFPGGGGTGRRGGGGGGMSGSGGMSGGGGIGSGGNMGSGMGGEGGEMSIPREFLMLMALSVPIRQAVFPLDGRETVVDIPGNPANDGRPAMPGVMATLKSAWKKDGRQLELILIRKFSTPKGDRLTTNRDRWELEKDGTLVVRRQVETRIGGQEVKLFFKKV